jgi:hypothetical protein
MTLGEQRRKALELIAPPPSRRHECLRGIEYALDWVSGPARTAFKIFGSKEGRAGLRRDDDDLGAHKLCKTPANQCTLTLLPFDS